MTIAAAWVRKIHNCEELIFISDSRLCGGHRWDECPKLTTLPGDNCVLAFAGDTGYAYPMMMQIRQAMNGYSLRFWHSRFHPTLQNEGFVR